MPTVTKRKFIEAMELNGYNQFQGGFWKTDDPLSPLRGNIVGACAVGQALLNLGVGFKVFDDPTSFSKIYAMNDQENRTIKQIVRYLKKEWKNSMDDTIEFYTSDEDYHVFDNYQGVKVSS